MLRMPLIQQGDRVVQVSLAILAILALLVAFRVGRIFLMPTMLGGLIALAATPLCALIERTGLPSAVSALIVTLSIIIGAGALGWNMLPSLDEWRYRAPEVAISLERKLRRLESQVEEVTATAKKVAPDMRKAEEAPEGTSTGSKAAAFAAMLRIFGTGLWSGDVAAVWVPLVVILAAASMILGNVAALLQDNVKRMLAYSSIGHAGYILMGLVALGAETSLQGGALRGSAGDLFRFATASVLVYALVYTFTNVGAFGIVAALRRSDRPGVRVADFAGLARTNPWLAFAMLVFLLSLAGIPATAGFIGKWYLFGAAVRADYAWLAVVAVLMSVVSAYYYLRIVVAMYMGEASGEGPARVAPALAGTLAVALIFTLLIGLYPQPFVNLAAQGAAQFQGLAWGG